MYNVDGAENCKYCQFITVPPAKDCMDYSGWGNGAELIYDSANVGNNVSNTKFSAYCFPDVLNTEYCLWCIASKNNFGCVNLKRKSYSILNKQYSKEEFEELKQKIIENMKKNPYADEAGRILALWRICRKFIFQVRLQQFQRDEIFPKKQRGGVTKRL